MEQREFEFAKTYHLSKIINDKLLDLDMVDTRIRQNDEPDPWNVAFLTYRSGLAGLGAFCTWYALGGYQYYRSFDSSNVPIDVYMGGCVGVASGALILASIISECGDFFRRTRTSKYLKSKKHALVRELEPLIDEENRLYDRYFSQDRR